MGCTNNSAKKQETEIEGRKTTENGLKNLFYATTEFDISASDSEDENVILSVKAINKKNNNDQQKLTKKIDKITSGLTTANMNTSTTSSTLLDNRLGQTRV